MTIVLRSAGSPLTNDQIDGNFTDLNNRVTAAAAAVAAIPAVQVGAIASSATQPPNATAVINAIAAAIAGLINSAPGALDTLKELADALGDDANFASTITALVNAKQAQLVSGTNIKTINGISLIGSGDLVVVGSGGGGGDMVAANNLSDLANKATARTNLGVAIGTDVLAQAHAGTGGAAHANVIAGGAAGFMTGTDKSKLDGVASGATANSSDATLLARANHTGTQLSSTISDFASASQAIANSAIAGLAWKQTVRAATTANGTLASAFANGQVIDGVTLATGDRVLLKNQTTASENGIYVVQASGAPVRATDANTGAQLVDASVMVSEGTTLADTQWTCTTNAPITPGTTALAFAQFTGSGPSSTDALTEGSTNKYYTDARVRAAVLTGIDVATTGAVSATDSVLAAIGKLQATKVGALAAVALTGANTLTQAAHANRHLSWTGGSTAAQALPTTQSFGDIIECTNKGTVPITFTNVNAAAGYKKSCLPGETFQAVSDGTVWDSLIARVNNAIQVLTPGATVATDLDIGGVSSLLAGQNFTLSNPTNPQDGGVYGWWITQDATGSRVLTPGSKFKKGAADSLTLSTGANKVDFLTATYNLAKDIYLSRVVLDIG